MIRAIQQIQKVKDKRVVLLQSGGLDSCICAAIFHSLGFECQHVFVDYGQSCADKEFQAARSIAAKYDSAYNFQVVKLAMPWLAISCNITDGHTIEDGYADAQEFEAVSSGVYVPLRNHILISIAGSLAESLKIPYIGVAIDGMQTLLGKPVSPLTDVHKKFVERTEKSLTEGSSLYHVDHMKFQVLAPLAGLFKEDIIKIGAKYHAPFDLSWSCYNSGAVPCGKCSSCLQRALGFDTAGIEDTALKKVNNPIDGQEKMW